MRIVIVLRDRWPGVASEAAYLNVRVALAAVEKGIHGVKVSTRLLYGRAHGILRRWGPLFEAQKALPKRYRWNPLPEFSIYDLLDPQLDSNPY